MSRRSAFGSIEKRAHNVYRLRWRDEGGSRRSETVHGTKYAAQRRLAEIQLSKYGSYEDINYETYWNDTVKPTFSGLSDHTVKEYERVWKVELAPLIQDASIAETTWKDVQSVMDGISASSVQRKAFRLWRKILNMAIRDGIRTTNPCDRSIRLKQHVKRRKVLLESQDVRAWMESIRGYEYEVLLLILAGGGLRPGEALALTTADVEPYELGGDVYAKVDISKVVVQASGDSYVRPTTKNGSSNRVQLIGKPYAPRILELVEGGYLDALQQNGTLKPSTVAHSYKKWCAATGVTHVTMENLRSSYATMHGEAGSLDSLVSFSMGHSDGSTRAANYQTATLKGLAMIADSLAEYLETV